MCNFIETGNLIRKYREERDLTIDELAELCDLSYSCISNIERGRSNPKLSSVIKIFSVLDRDLNELKRFISPQDIRNENKRLLSKLELTKI